MRWRGQAGGGLEGRFTGRSSRSAVAILLAVVLSLLAPRVARASTLAVDGSAADWGFNILTGTTSSNSHPSTFNVNSGVNLLALVTEDQSDLAGDGGYLGPNYGGQNYDVEALAVALQGSSLYVVIVTGQRPDNGFSRYAPGDIRFTMAGGGTFGIEVGGGPGQNPDTDPPDVAINEGAPGTTFSLNSSGFTAGYASHLLDQVAGSVWKDPTWIYDPIAPPSATQLQFAGGTNRGLADYTYTRNALAGQHAIIEAAIPLSFFEAGGTISTVEWRPACGNDELIAQVNFTPVPEPGTLFLLGSGLAGVAAWRRRRAGR